MQLLNLSEDDMKQIFESIYYDTEKEPWKWVEDFLEDYVVDETLEYIQMFHLSRRLNGTNPSDNNNLKQLLLEESPLSLFLKKHEVTFEKGDGHINLFYKGKLQLLDNEFQYDNGNIYYVRSRLGYNTVQDYCVNGFAFRSYLEENNYFKSLSRCPELVQNIEWLLGINGMIWDYYNNSKYYCIEYLIPLSEVIFDISYPPETERDKTLLFLNRSILRLYDGWIGSSFTCDENLILRLSDDAMINPEWFVNVEEIFC
jgi:hypothetical protein